MGNPFAHPVSTIFYLAPGFYVHAFLNGDINDYDETAEWTVGNTTYVVLDGGNPWGMMLRDLGLPVPNEFDNALSTLVPVPMPGQQATVADQPVPTPRELQERIYQRLGWTVPVTDPDVVDKQDDQSTAQSTAAVPNRIMLPTATTQQQSTDPTTDDPQYSNEDQKGPQSTTIADKTAGTSGDTRHCTNNGWRIRKRLGYDDLRERYHERHDIVAAETSQDNDNESTHRVHTSRESSSSATGTHGST